MFARLWVDEEHCENWIDSISQYHQKWDENRNMFLEVPYHNWTSHYADVYRYASVAEDLMSNEKEKPYVAPKVIATSRYEGTVDPNVLQDEEDISKW
jgi:hypothetical protein